MPAQMLYHNILVGTKFERLYAIIRLYLREGPRFATAAEHGKCKNEDHDLGSAVQGCRQNIVVLDKQVGVILSKPPLRGEAKDKVHAAGGVDAGEQIAHVPEDDGRVDVLEQRGVAKNDRRAIMGLEQ